MTGTNNFLFLNYIAQVVKEKYKCLEIRPEISL